MKTKFFVLVLCLSFAGLIFMSGGEAWSQFLLGSDTYSWFNYDVDYGWFSNTAQFASMPGQALADRMQYSTFANMGISSLSTQLTAPGTTFSLLNFPGGLLAGWYGSGSLTDSFRISDLPYINRIPSGSKPFPVFIVGDPLSSIWQSDAIPTWWAHGSDIDTLLDYVIKLNYLDQLPK